MADTTPNELLHAIEIFLRDSVVPQLSGFTAYNTKVAINSLKIVQRELELNGQLKSIDERKATRLGLQLSDGEIAEHLSLAIRDDSIAIDQSLIEYLKERTVKKLEIDNPKYSGYLQALELWSLND